MRKLQLLLMTAALLIASSVMAQNAKVSGLVVDERGEAIIGATVQLQGSKGGTVTDLDGHFSIDAPEGSMLVISFIGYETRTMRAANNMRVSLKESNEHLNEVVVVGYGTQKKVNLTGSVSSISGDEIAALPASDAVSALQGQLPGVQVLRSSGQPGSESSGMRIRGFSSVNSTSTLVLIDGVEGDLSLLNADDIESISVLKDAAASAIYGARAASGVVLVTTKNGVGDAKVKVQYNGYYAINTPGNMPKRLPAWEEQDMINESRLNASGKVEWNPEQSSWVANPNFNYRPNNSNGRWDLFEATNWVAEGVKDYTSQTNHSVSVSGGNKNLNYLVSGNVFYKNGLLKYGPDDVTRYNLHAKLNAELNQYVTLRTNIQYQSKKNKTNSFGASGILGTLYSSRGRQPIYAPEEDINDSPYNGDLQVNAIDIEKNAGTSTSKYEAFLGKAELNVHDLVKGLSLNLSASRRAGYYSNATVRRHLVWYDRLGKGIRQQANNPNSLTKQKNNDYHDLLEATLNYKLSLNGKHNFEALAGVSYENYRKDEISATAKNMNSNDFFSFNYYDASDVANTSISDNISPWSMMSYFGRLTYNYAERYLFEGNIRYDGSSRLAPSRRWKAFPSFSAAWRITEEPWFKVKQIDNLKIRGSWGQLGNGAVLGLYDYIATISSGTQIAEKYYYQSTMASTDKTWETIATTDLGIDITAFANRLNLSFDYYWKTNDDMLSSLQLPHTVGIGVPNANVGKLKTWGWDFQISWRDKIGKVNYQIGLNFSDSDNKLVEYDGADVIQAGNVALLEGESLNTIWGYKTDGYWKSREEYQQYKEAHPGYKSFNDGTVGAGDVKYVAIGTPDHQLGGGSGTKADHGDLVKLGNSNGRYFYGINLSAQYSGFDFSMMVQGVAKRKVLIDASALAPFFNSYQMPWTIHRDYWTEDNQDAYWPRLYNYSGNDFNFKPSDKWIQDASYVRLKNVTLGYTLPTFSSFISKLRVYVAGEDLWEHSKLLKVYDPEIGNNMGRNYYPFFRTWTVGLNITF